MRNLKTKLYRYAQPTTLDHSPCLSDHCGNLALEKKTIALSKYCVFQTELSSKQIMAQDRPSSFQTPDSRLQTPHLTNGSNRTQPYPEQWRRSASVVVSDSRLQT